MITEERMNEMRKSVMYMKAIGNSAIHEAIEENRGLGIPNAFSKNGKLYYEMPDGSIQRELSNS